MNNKNKLCFMVKYNQLPFSIGTSRLNFLFIEPLLKYVVSEHQMLPGITENLGKGLEFWISLFLEFMSNMQFLTVMSNCVSFSMQFHTQSRCLHSKKWIAAMPLDWVLSSR